MNGRVGAIIDYLSHRGIAPLEAWARLMRHLTPANRAALQREPANRRRAWLKSHAKKLGNFENAEDLQEVITLSRFARSLPTHSYKMVDMKRYRDALETLIKKNTRVRLNIETDASLLLRAANNNKTFVILAPFNTRNASRGVTIRFGQTAPNRRRAKLGPHPHNAGRMAGWGTLLRKYAINAAKATNLNLYQESVNMNSLIAAVNANQTPASGRIMKSLGAVEMTANQKRHMGLPVGSMWFRVPRGTLN